MDSEVTTSRQPYGSGNPITIFITSLSAAIVVAGGFGIIIEAFIVAGADLFGLGHIFVLIGSVLTVLLTLWLFVVVLRPLLPCRAPPPGRARGR